MILVLIDPCDPSLNWPHGPCLIDPFCPCLIDPIAPSKVTPPPHNPNSSDPLLCVSSASILSWFHACHPSADVLGDFIPPHVRYPAGVQCGCHTLCLPAIKCDTPLHVMVTGRGWMNLWRNYRDLGRGWNVRVTLHHSHVTHTHTHTHILFEQCVN